MDCYLHEAIALISLDDEKGNFTSAGGYINYAFGAAFVMDLLLEERIKLEEDRVHLLTNAITDSRALNSLIEQIGKRKKPERVSNWIHLCVERLGKLRQLTVDKLVADGTLAQTEGKILWVFSVDRYPTQNPQPENELRQRLKALMLDESTEPDQKERMLLTILLKCELYAEMVEGKQQRKTAKGRLENLTSDDKMQKEVGRAIQEMLALVMITTTTMVATSS
ncbi:MAG: GPP34 family phosphoprotein [Phaeodactylibacter sp.]|uniref:GOLPH3/VPS74 family protein n=1 Tax=Phaeodactylibacter sp. TaxID=1940289 RepID=UPI0032EF5E5B